MVDNTAMQEDNHIFQGMKRNGHQIRQEANFLWDAHNIRITSRESDSLFSITNERGTSLSLDNITGQYVGHIVVGQYLVLFTTTNSTSYIYRIQQKNDSLKQVVLYKGAKIFSINNPIEAICDIEGEYVQKVYWIDRDNQPRVINITKPELLEVYNNNESDYSNLNNYSDSFDFIRELTLNESIQVNKSYTNGNFPSGVIQYAFSYYNIFGQESNIFYTTPLQYISPEKRGGSPEETNSNSFLLTIKNPDTKFDYLRIYSILRTSINAIPTVKRVVDIKVSSAQEIHDTATNTTTRVITFTDTGNIGDTIDPSKLLYIGGEPIKAGSIESKDGTMFLGNISINTPVPSLSKEDIKANVTITLEYRETAQDQITATGYQHSNNLLQQPRFKAGETYRIGIQLQHKNGRWSQPIHIKDFEVPDSCRPTNNGHYIIKIDIQQILENAYRDGYIKVRGVIVPQALSDRRVIAQGMLCPTVFNVKSRLDNAPFSQASWFLRPFSKDYNVQNNTSQESMVEFRHWTSLLAGKDYGAEIQCNTKQHLTAPVKSTDYDDDLFFVDQSILTFHSPEIEYNESLKYEIEKEQELEVRIVGLINFTCNYSDSYLQTSTPTINPEAKGYIGSTIEMNSGRGLSSSLLYQDGIVQKKDGQYKMKDTYNTRYNYLVYPWSRNGSINNDCVRPTDAGTRTAVLNKKVISNLKFSLNNTWLTKAWVPKNGITPIKVFNSDQISLLKIKVPANNFADIKDTINYYGNINSMVVNKNSYPTAYLASYGSQNVIPIGGNLGDSNLIHTKDPVSMKYKSTSHAVFALNYLMKEGKQILPYALPILSDASITYSTKPFWVDKWDVGHQEQISIIKEKHDTLPDTAAYQYNDIILAYNYKGHLYIYILEGYEEWTEVPIGDTMYEYTDPNTQVVTYYQQTEFGAQEVVRDGSYTPQIDSLKESLPKVILPDGTQQEYIQKYPYLYLAEIVRKNKIVNQYGGSTDEALQNNMWIPASEPYLIEQGNSATIILEYGDTWYSRYDCLKTYPFTSEDANQIVEIGSFMCETRINLDGRWDINRGLRSNINMSPINFNKMNNIYSQQNNFFNYRILDHIIYKSRRFNNQITWTLRKDPMSDVDPWTNISLSSILNLDGKFGNIIKLISFNDNLLCFQERALNHILFNSRVQIPVSDGVPVEISNGYKVEGSRLINNSIGLQNKQSICTTPLGIYFIDNVTNSLYLYNGQLSNISQISGMNLWIRKFYNTPLLLSFENLYGDVYLIPPVQDSEALCFSTQLQQFTSFMSYGGICGMFNLGNKAYSIFSNNEGLCIYQNFAGQYNNFFGINKSWSISFISNQNPTTVKVFDTVDLRADIYNQQDILMNISPVKKIVASNEYQSSQQELDNKNMRKKFRIWRATIPRCSPQIGKIKDRIRNLWAEIKLYGNDDNNRVIIHDVSVKYTT